MAEILHWPVWWKNLTRTQKFKPVLLVLLFWGVNWILGGLHSDHLLLGLIILALSYGGKSAHIVLHFILPVILTGIVYDSQKYYKDFLQGTIHVQFPYDFDKKLFGIDTDAGRLTPNEWWQLHLHPLLDLVCGFFYLFFIAIYVTICAWHRFFLPYRQKDPVLRNRAEKLGPLSTWAFFWINVLGYSTYYWLPAAPPWYVAKYGLGPANLAALPDPAGCIRFDELLGTSFFTSMYSKSANIFGAIPSLHISYPALAMLFAFQLKSVRAFSTFFYVIMCFSAVYLNHHYILDVIWGSVYAVLIWWWTNLYANSKTTRELSDLKYDPLGPV
jgi:membrane-associated phospholipid phosphatase